jgi:pilus assembly protein CpaD
MATLLTSWRSRASWRSMACAFACLAAGCAPIVPPSTTTASLPQPHVAEVELLHTVYFDTDIAELRPEEAHALREFVRLTDERLSIDQVVVGHADVRGSDAYNDPLSERRAESVTNLLQREGIPADRISRQALGRRFPVEAADQATSWQLSRRVEILARGVVVVEPNCPDWSRPSAWHPDNLPTSNFGCATTVNLMRMVADPRDLIRGSDLGPADGTREAEAINRYRTDEVKPLQLEAVSQ